MHKMMHKLRRIFLLAITVKPNNFVGLGFEYFAQLVKQAKTEYILSYSVEKLFVQKRLLSPSVGNQQAT